MNTSVNISPRRRNKLSKRSSRKRRWYSAVKIKCSKLIRTWSLSKTTKHCDVLLASKATKTRSKFSEYTSTPLKLRFYLWRAGGKTTKNYKRSQVHLILSLYILTVTSMPWRTTLRSKKHNGTEPLSETVKFCVITGVLSRDLRPMMTISTKLQGSTLKKTIRRSVSGSSSMTSADFSRNLPKNTTSLMKLKVQVRPTTPNWFQFWCS